jgi:hypothetical protein
MKTSAATSSASAALRTCDRQNRYTGPAYRRYTSSKVSGPTSVGVRSQVTSLPPGQVAGRWQPTRSGAFRPD